MRAAWGDVLQAAEGNLQTAQASSVLYLDQWSHMEECSPFPLPLTPSSSSPLPPCTVNGTYMDHCQCYWRFSDPNYELNTWLDKFVSNANLPCNVDGGRSAVIQLGTLFDGRTVPPYLANVPFDDVQMIQAFARLWDAVSAILAKPEFNNNHIASNGTIVIDVPQWIISIGNEVNWYLDKPDAVDGDITSAWTKYASFYAQTSRYVRGLPVDLGDGRLTTTRRPASCGR